MRTHDASNERKTADVLLRHLEDVIADVQLNWQVRPIALVGDASGESRKARVDFGKSHKEFIVLDCYAHQVNCALSSLYRSME